MSIGKSRLGRQSPYQEDLSAPPRPKTSISGSSIVMSGVGTPTRTTRAGEVAGVERLLEDRRVADGVDGDVHAEPAGERLDRLDRVGLLAS